jgi:hypothetical protein
MNSLDKSGPDWHTLTYALTENDAWALLKVLGNAFPGTPGHPAPRWVKAGNALLRWSFNTLPIYLLVSIVLVMSFTDSAIRMWQVILVAIVGLIAGGSTVFMLPERKLHPYVREFIGLGRLQTLVFSSDGLVISSEGRASFCSWDRYTDVELASDFILVYRGQVADFFPLSAFPNREQAEECARFIAGRIKEFRS